MAGDVDAKLVTALRQAKSNPMQFAFVAKGASDGALIVSKKKIPAKEINEAKAACGGKLVFKGRCVGDEGQLVFEIPMEPPGQLAKQIKTVIQRDAGMMLKVETRFAPDLATEEGTGETSEGTPESSTATPPPPPPPPEAARVTSRLKALGPILQKVEGLKSPQVKEIKQALKEANDFTAKKDYASANETLDIVESMIKEVLAPTPTTTPPVPPPPPQDTAAVVKRLNALSSAIKVALKGPNGSRIQALFVAVNGLVKNNDAVEANKVLAELEGLVGKPPETTPGPKVTGATGKKVLFQQSRLVYDQARKMAQAELRKVQQAILADPEVKALNDPDIPQVVEALAGALADFDDELIDALDAALNAANDTDRDVAENEARAVIKRYQGKLDNEVLNTIDDNGFTSVKVRATLETTLSTLAAKLG